MNPTRGMHSRLQQQQQQQEARERTHEPICVKETRVCWIEFGASLTCLSLGIIFVFAGVSADSSAVGSSGGSQATKPAGILAVTYLGVALLIIGGALLIVFGIHFYRVKSGLDAAKAERFAQLGIQPSSRYQELPSQSATAAAFGSRPRPPVLPLPSRDPVQQQQRRVPQEQRPQPSQMSSSRLQPMPSYREGAFYNLGFLSDEAEAARSPAQPQVATISTGRAPSQQPSPLNNKLSPYAQHGAQPPADRTRQGPAGRYNLPPPGDQVRRGPSAQFDPRPTTDQARNASSAQYGVQQRDDHPRRSQQAVQAHQDVPQQRASLNTRLQAVLRSRRLLCESIEQSGLDLPRRQRQISPQASRTLHRLAQSAVCSPRAAIIPAFLAAQPESRYPHRPADRIFRPRQPLTTLLGRDARTGSRDTCRAGSSRRLRRRLRRGRRRPATSGIRFR
ncbi:hypothetical protein BOX15_Mlig026798g2 [Macrostomum lignano]|uniref:Uncharacterized protein n=1 Tax=Macrostomum lignano TaxID=282301 RepID=A0A267FD90_9PLAT|nr:hypothetical protein BOX15_Mlig026798g2 [Macrostomum lignano]